MSDHQLLRQARQQLELCTIFAEELAAMSDNPYIACRDVLGPLIKAHDDGGEATKVLAGMALEAVVPAVHMAITALADELKDILGQ